MYTLLVYGCHYQFGRSNQILSGRPFHFRRAFTITWVLLDLLILSYSKIGPVTILNKMENAYLYSGKSEAKGQIPMSSSSATQMPHPQFTGLYGATL